MTVTPDDLARALLDGLAGIRHTSPPHLARHPGDHMHSIECTSEEGITIGLIDAAIGALNALRGRDLSGTGAQEAIADLRVTICRALPEHGPDGRWLSRENVANVLRSYERAGEDNLAPARIARAYLAALDELAAARGAAESPESFRRT
jgi:hypothetical protein